MFKSSNVAKLFRNKFADFYQFPRNVEETENEMERLKLEDESRTWEEESGVLEMSQNFSDVLGLSCEREYLWPQVRAIIAGSTMVSANQIGGFI